MPWRRAMRSSARCSSLRTSRRRGSCSNRSPRADAREHRAQNTDVFLTLLPRDQKPGRARVLRAPVIEFDAGLAYLALALITQGHEDLIGLDRSEQARGGSCADALRQLVGALRMTPPQPRFDIGKQLCGGVARLGDEVTGAFASQLEIGHARDVKKYHRLGAERAGLGGAE